MLVKLTRFVDGSFGDDEVLINPDSIESISQSGNGQLSSQIYCTIRTKSGDHIRVSGWLSHIQEKLTPKA